MIPFTHTYTPLRDMRETLKKTFRFSQDFYFIQILSFDFRCPLVRRSSGHYLRGKGHGTRFWLDTKTTGRGPLEINLVINRFPSSRVRGVREGRTGRTPKIKSNEGYRESTTMSVYRPTKRAITCCVTPFYSEARSQTQGLVYLSLLFTTYTPTTPTPSLTPRSTNSSITD